MENSLVNQDQWCFAWLATERASAGQFRAVLLNAAKWQSGDKISVSFLDGDSRLRARVEAAAQIWTGPGKADVRFVFQEDTDSMVRISFRGKGSWSVIGTTCLHKKDRQEPTVNFGWLTPESPDETLQRVVLHEFGHALGLIHEHQHPDKPIDWNRDAVIRDLSTGANAWSPQEIEQNMFEAYRKRETNFSAFDPHSIMLYPIPKTWTRNGFSVGLNSRLSDTDIAFIRKQYP